MRSETKRKEKLWNHSRILQQMVSVILPPGPARIADRHCVLVVISANITSPMLVADDSLSFQRSHRTWTCPETNPPSWMRGMKLQQDRHGGEPHGSSHPRVLSPEYAILEAPAKIDMSLLNKMETRLMENNLSKYHNNILHWNLSDFHWFQSANFRKWLFFSKNTIR